MGHRVGNWILETDKTGTLDALETGLEWERWTRQRKGQGNRPHNTRLGEGSQLYSLKPHHNSYRMCSTDIHGITQETNRNAEHRNAAYPLHSLFYICGLRVGKDRKGEGGCVCLIFFRCLTASLADDRGLP